MPSGNAPAASMHLLATTLSLAASLTFSVRQDNAGYESKSNTRKILCGKRGCKHSPQEGFELLNVASGSNTLKLSKLDTKRKVYLINLTSMCR